jgi:hypothetical protein
MVSLTYSIFSTIGPLSAWHGHGKCTGLIVSSGIGGRQHLGPIVGAMRPDQRPLPRPRPDRIPLGADLLAPPLRLLQRMANAGKGGRPGHHGASFTVLPSLSEPVQSARFFRQSPITQFHQNARGTSRMNAFSH